MLCPGSRRRSTVRVPIQASSAPTTTHGRLDRGRPGCPALPKSPKRSRRSPAMPRLAEAFALVVAFPLHRMECPFRRSLAYLGLSGPQTHQPVLGDGQGIGAYSKSKLLRLVRYCDEVEQAAASSARSFVTLKVIDLSSARIRTRRSGALSAAARATA